MSTLKVKSNPVNTANIKPDSVLVQGDLSSMSEDQRSTYYLRVCESLGLNPHTQPFEYIRLSGQLKLYATRACSDQLRKLHGVSISISSRELIEEIYTVVARAEDAAGRTDEASGVVSIKGLSGEARANALMKCETKAKRRVTLSICGLGFLDETEVDTIPNERKVTVTTRGVTVIEAVKAPALIAPKLPVPQADDGKKLSSFRELCLAVEQHFPGTMQRMLSHYQVDSVEAMVEAQMNEAADNLVKKLQVKGGGKA